MNTPRRVPHRPPWPRKKLVFSPEVHELKRVLRKHRVRSVCEDAKCPNISECFGRRETTFIILGDRCTRRCSFCAIPAGRTSPPDPDEPARLAEAAAELSLTHVVVTAVARDDLDDGGADHFARCVDAIRARSPETTVEVLTSDFKGDERALQRMAACDLHVFNHNIETVERLQRSVRPQARYTRSLDVLARFKALRPDVATKSGLMLGLGEADGEVEQAMRDVRAHHVDILTIGQYMQPLARKQDVDRYASLERFAALEAFGDELGFALTLSGPYVRSSFNAAEAARAIGVVRSRTATGEPA